MVNMESEILLSSANCSHVLSISLIFTITCTIDFDRVTCLYISNVCLTVHASSSSVMIQIYDSIKLSILVTFPLTNSRIFAI
jgi:hypothetical protein